MATKRITLTIEGMSCTHCVAQVQSAAEDQPGVTEAAVAIGTATINLDPSVTSEGALIDAIESAGYTVTASAPA